MKTITRLFLICVLVAPLTAVASAYAVATAHPLATQAGEEILAEGGNAFDAAVAISAVLGVVEPSGSGFGGGGFWLLHESETGRDVMVDGREVAPQAAHAGLYLDKSGEVIADLSVNGALAAAIPGMPAALVHIAERYGSLPLPRLLAPAVRHAAQGFAADARFVRYVKSRLDALKASPQASAIFLVGNDLPEVGDNIRQVALAHTIGEIARHGRDGFYRGAVAQELLASVRDAGGIWHPDDLADYRVIERQPIRIRYKGADITGASPPSSGGIVIAEILNILSQFDLEKMSPLQKKHHIIEAMRRAYKDRSLWLGDPDFVKIPQYLTDKQYAATLARGIDAGKATPSVELGRQKEGGGEDTTHFSIIDSKGNRVAATLSINYPFGCGLVAGMTGVLLNNEMDDFAAAPGVANLYGLTGSEANSIAGGKRMLSSMSPTFVEDGDRLAVIGTPGGSRIITMVLLGIMRFLDGGSAEDIVSLPRYHHQYLPDVVTFETGALSVGMQRGLQKLGHGIKHRQRPYGNMQVVIQAKRSGTLSVASDPRGIGTTVIGMPR